MGRKHCSNGQETSLVIAFTYSAVSFSGPPCGESISCDPDMTFMIFTFHGLTVCFEMKECTVSDTRQRPSSRDADYGYIIKSIEKCQSACTNDSLCKGFKFSANMTKDMNGQCINYGDMANISCVADNGDGCIGRIAPCDKSK
jgi:hypothetical protein